MANKYIIKRKRNEHVYVQECCVIVCTILYVSSRAADPSVFDYDVKSQAGSFLCHHERLQVTEIWKGY